MPDFTSDRLEHRLEKSGAAFIATSGALSALIVARFRDEDTERADKQETPKKLRLIITARDEGRTKDYAPVRNFRLSFTLRGNAQTDAGKADPFNTAAALLERLIDDTNLRLALDSATLGVRVMLAVRRPGCGFHFDGTVRNQGWELECRAVAAENVATAGVLTVTPAGAFVATGAAGGPFTPSSNTYTLENTGTEPLVWTAAKTTAWVTLSATTGALDPDDTVVITATINAGAETLTDAAYFDSLTFTNVTSPSAATAIFGLGLVVGAGGDTVIRKTGSTNISSGASSFDITFAEAFTDVPAFADVVIAPPTGQPALGIAKIVRAADKLTVTLDTATPATGYTANWFALLS